MHVERLVFDGGLPAVLGLAFFELDHFVHDELPVAGGNLRVAGGQIGAGDLQVHGGLLLRFACANGTTAAAVARSVVCKAVLLAGHVIVNVVASAVFAAVESVSLSHNCVHSDEFTTVDLDSGREQVGVTQGGPELNPAGTSAGTHLWKSSKPLQFQLVRFGGEGRNRTESLYRSEPNTLCFKAYYTLILQGFKPFVRPPLHCPLIAPLPPFHCSLGEELGETIASQLHRLTRSEQNQNPAKNCNSAELCCHSE